MGEPTVTFVTRRHPARPTFFARCAASVGAQTIGGSQHLEVPTGLDGDVVGANKVLATDAYWRQIRGAYVYLLDDDDELADPRFVEAVEDLLSHRDPLHPKWIMVKGQLGEPGCPFEDPIWPKPWGPEWRPVRRTVSSLNLLVRKDVWIDLRAVWGQGKAGDWRLAKAMWALGIRPVFLDVLAARTQVISEGHPETAPVYGDPASPPGPVSP